jgi:hypothetical protein
MHITLGPIEQINLKISTVLSNYLNSRLFSRHTHYIAYSLCMQPLL